MSLLQKVKDFFDSASNEDLDRIVEEVNCLDDACEDCMIDKEEDLELIMKLDAESKGLISYNCPKCETLNFLKVGNNHCVNCQNEIWRKTV